MGLSVLVIVAVLVGVLLAVKLGGALIFLRWVQSLGPWGPVVMALALIVASLPVPFLFGLFTVSSGFLFGIWLGLLTTMVGCGLGSMIVFLFSRFVFREKVEQSIATNPLFLRFNGRIEKEGWKLALVMRLASVPFGFVNVFLAVTKLPMYMFALTTLVGELPIAFIGCFAGSTLGSLSEAAGGEAKWTTQRIVLFVLEAVIAVIFLTIAFLVSRKMVKESMDEVQGEEGVATPLRRRAGLSEDEDEVYAGTYEMPIERLQVEDFDVEVASQPQQQPLSPSRSSSAGGVIRRSRSNSPPKTPARSASFGAL